MDDCGYGFVTSGSIGNWNAETLSISLIIIINLAMQSLYRSLSVGTSKRADFFDVWGVDELS